MANRVLCTKHLLVHEHAVQLVQRYNGLVRERSDQAVIATGLITVNTVVLSFIWIASGEPPWVSIAGNALALSLFKVGKEQFEVLFNGLPIKSKSSERTELTTPKIDDVINVLGEGQIDLTLGDVAIAACKTIAACNPDIE